MKIAIIATHSFPISNIGVETHSGDIVILDLVKALEQLDHEVVFITGEEGYKPNGGLLPMRMSYGRYPPSSNDCETESYNKYKDILQTCDIVHDFSITKCITENLYQSGYKNVIQTIMGGPWRCEILPRNLIVWSKAHRDRVLRGATDFEDIPFLSGLGGNNGIPVNDAHVVFGGIDTNFYYPSGVKENYYLLVGRWHIARGHKFAIELAKQIGIELIIAGEHPDNELFDSQKQYALEIIELGKNLPNVHFEFLPKEIEPHHLAKRNLMQKAKCLLLPTQLQEAFGLTLIETLACGTPIISTNYGSMPQLLKNNITGFVCENTIDSFIEAIDKIDDIDPKVCRKEAVEKFDRKVMAQNYIKEYEKILNRETW